MSEKSRRWYSNLLQEIFPGIISGANLYIWIIQGQVHTFPPKNASFPTFLFPIFSSNLLPSVSHQRVCNGVSRFNDKSLVGLRSASDEIMQLKSSRKKCRLPQPLIIWLTICRLYIDIMYVTGCFLRWSWKYTNKQCFGWSNMTKMA